MRFSNSSNSSLLFSSIIRLSVLLLIAGVVPIKVLAAPPVSIGTPEWTVPIEISTDDGYADLQWEMPAETTAEFYKLTENKTGSQRESYIESSDLHVYRVEPGWYDFKVAACQKNSEGLPVCGQDSSRLRLTVTEKIFDTFPHNQSQSSTQTFSAAVAGGPDQLRPGLWYDPDKSGQGWSFYWANRLALPENDPLFGNAYDLIGVYYTFESKNDPSQPGEPEPLDSYRPVVVTFKAILTGPDTYSGNISIVRQGATDSTGSAVVTFGTNNTSATIDWDMHFKLEYLSDVDSLSLLLGSDPSSINNATHYSGLWEHATDDSYFVVNDIANIAEAATLVFYDNAGDPVWLQAVNGGAANSSNTYLCFSYLSEGYRANRSTPAGWSQVWYDSGCNSSQTVNSSNRNGRRYFSDFGTERFWASFTIAGIDYSAGSVTVGSYSSPAYLLKKANFHGITYEYAGGSSCVTSVANPCTPTVTWYTDGDYPGATAYAYNQTTSTFYKIQTSTQPVMENVPKALTVPGVYKFLLYMGDGVAGVTKIAESSSFTVTQNQPPNVPAFANPPTIYNGGSGNFSFTISDPDGDSLTCLEKNNSLPGGLIVSANVSNTLCQITGTVSSNIQTYAVVIEVSDNINAPVEASFNWTLGNTAPTATQPGNQSNSIGQSASLQIQAGDPDPGDSISYAATGLPNGLTINSLTGLISGVINAASGPYTVIVTVTDTHSGSDVVSFTWTIGNTPPTVSNPGTQINSNGNAVSLQIIASDPDIGNTLTYSTTGLPAGLSINTTSGLITGTLNDTVGNHAVTVTANDGNGGSDVEAFTWTIQNTAPVIMSPGNQTNDEGAVITLPIGASDADPGDTLNYIATGLPSGLSINTSNGVISGTIAVGAMASSPYSVTVTVNDSNGGSDQVVFTWTIGGNVSPTLTNPGTQIGANGDGVSLQVSATDPDVDDTLTYSATGLPAGLNINTASGLITGTLNDTVGNHAVTVTVDDGNGGSDVEGFSWDIQNTSPTINQSVSTLTFNLNIFNSANIAISDADPFDSLTCQISSGQLPTGLSVTDDGNNTNCVISGTASGSIGTYPIVVTVDDATGTASTPTINLQVFENTANPEMPPEPSMPSIAPSSSSSRVGTTAGQFRVDESGSATYSIPIMTAPGSGGVAPQISLSYSSQSGNGLLGVGWNLSGLSAITRCAQTIEQDSDAQGNPPLERSVTLTQSDRFCLDGQRLVLADINDTYGANGVEYRTEIDSITRIISHGTSGTGPTSFTVERKDGSTSKYGDTDDSRIEARRFSYDYTAITWLQNKFIDSAGNYINYIYDENGSIDTAGLVESVISKIEFTGNINTNTQPYAELVFSYDASRTDTPPAFIAGAEIQQTKRLTSISSKSAVAAGGTLADVRYYDLHYDTDGLGRNIIDDIEECNNSVKSVCFNPTTFTWIKSLHSIQNFEKNSPNPNDPVLPRNEIIYGMQLVDVNGDSRPDMLYTKKVGNKFKFFVKAANSGGYFISWGDSQGYELPKKKDESAPKVMAIDLNADGLQDVIYRKYITGNTYRWVRRISSGSDFGAEANVSQSSWDFVLDESDPKTTSRISVLDFNGDGLSDLLNNTSEILPLDNNLIFEVALNTGNPNGLLAAPVEYSVNLDDLFLPVPPPGENWEVFNDDVYAAKTPEGELLKNKVFDFNGDGTVDILRLVWRQFRHCIANCNLQNSSIVPSDPFDTSSSQSQQEPVYTYGMISYWVVVTPTGTSSLDYQVVGKGLGCTTAFLACNDEINDDSKSDYMIPVDINADGLSDLAFSNGYKNGTNLWYFKLNTGDGFTDPIQLTPSALPAYTNEQVRFEDMNGDGFPDFLYPSAVMSQNAVWKVIYNDFGWLFSTVSMTSWHAGHVGEDGNGESTENDASIFADITGNGKLDQLYFNFNSQAKIPSSNQDSGLYKGFNSISLDPGEEANNVIESIENGLGAITTLDYLPLTDPTVYTRMHDAPGANWGEGSVVYDLIAPIYVVSKATSSAPVFGNPAASSNVQYHYVGAKMQGGGRGYLGFGEVISYDPQSGIRTNTRYRQDFPYTGMPADTMQAVNASGSKFNRLSNTSASTPQAWGNVSSTTPAPSSPGGTRLSYAINEWSIKTTAGSAKFSYISNSLESSYTLSGSFNRKVLSSTSYDIYGNVETSTIQTYTETGSLFATQSTSNTYYAADLANWYLGRLETSNVTHSRSGPITRKVKFEYDSGTGILNKEIIEPGDAYLEVVTTYGLDDFGNRRSTSVTGKNMSPRTSSVVYDSLGRFVIENKNALGQTTLKTNTWDVFGNALEQQNIDNVYTTNTFDYMGRRFASMTGSPSVQNSWTGAYSKTVNSTTTANCPSGAVFKTTTTGGGKPTQFQCFDVLGRATRTAVEKLGGVYAYTDQYYDSSGRVERVSEPYFSGDTQYWNTTSYDKLGRITSVDSAAGDDQVIDYDSDPNIVCTTANVRVVQTTNGLGQVRVEVRNALGEAEEVYDEQCGKLTYIYDAVGNLTEVTGADNEVVTMSYDKAGRKTTMNDPDKGYWQYAYNALDEMTRQLDSKNQAIDFTYDALGRVTNRLELSGVSSLTDSVYITENKETSSYRSISPGKGQPSLITYRSGEAGAELHKKSFSYDAFGRVQFVSTSIDASTYAEETTYDQYSRVFQQFDASGDNHGLRYVYANGYVSAIKEAREGTSGTIYQDIQTMDARGNVTAMQLGNGVDVIATYEPASGRLDRLDAWDGAIKIQDVDYLFDVLGNLKNRHDQSAGANLKETFGYDTLNRLETVDLSVNGAQAVTTLSLTYYDSGNIKTKSDVGTYLYNGAQQPHAVSSAGGNSYSYDDNGNQTSGDGRAILYTVFDKPYSITKNGNQVTFAYGVGNSRYQREDYEGGVLKKTTLYLGSTERITEDGSTFFKRYLGGVAIATYYPSTGVQQLAYLLKDHIGSIHTVLNESGAITANMHFSAFGQRQDVSDWQTVLTAYLYAPELHLLNDITTRGFTGHEQVDSMGIIHTNGRIYDPKLGRFLQADPVVQAPKNSQNLNRYSYVLNNPLSYTDPTGYFYKGFMKSTGMWATHKFFNRVPFLNAVVSVGLNYVPYCQVWCSALWNANSSYVATGSLSSAFKSGAITAAAGYAMKGIGSSAGLSDTQKLLAIATVGGIAAELQGGKFGHGFLSAGVGYQMGTVTAGNPTPVKFLAAMIAGGTVSEMTGGKFTNGAATAGFAYAISASAQAHVKDSGRPLTEKEKAEAYKAYGDEIKDYDSVRIYSRKWAFFQGKDYVMAPDGNIYWPAAKGCSDLTACTLTTSDRLKYETLPTFIHEMGHVMQHQQGINVVLRAFPHQLLHAITLRKYDPYMTRQKFYATPTPLSLNVEAQADWFMHNYCTQSGGC